VLKLSFTFPNRTRTTAACARNELSGICTNNRGSSKAVSQNGHGKEYSSKKTRRKAATRKFAGNNILLLIAKKLCVFIIARGRFDFLFLLLFFSPDEKASKSGACFVVSGAEVSMVSNHNLKVAKCQSTRVKSNPLLSFTAFFHSITVKIKLYDF